jgi:hypothetical protein
MRGDGPFDQEEEKKIYSQLYGLADPLYDVVDRFCR